MQAGAAQSRSLGRWSVRAAASWPLGFFVFDRVVKYLVAHTPQPQSRGLWYVGYAHNAAGPLSLPVANNMLIAVGCVALLLAVAFSLVAWRLRRAPALVAILFVVAGGASNIMDRVQFGGVVDVFHLTVLSTLSFNLADIGIVGGLISLAVFW